MSLDYEEGEWFNCLMFYGSVVDQQAEGGGGGEGGVVLQQSDMKQEPLDATTTVEEDDIKPTLLSSKTIILSTAPNDLDLKLVPSVVEKLLLPKLTSQLVET